MLYSSLPSSRGGAVQHAEVAEPADALRSGRSARKGVGVQISPSAPRFARVTRRGPHFDKRPLTRCPSVPDRRDVVVGRRMVAGPFAGPEESPSCIERGARRKPGRRAPARRQSRSACRPRPVREQQRPGPPGTPGGVKRAILPAAISESADKDGGSPRPEVESSHGGDDVTGPAWRGRER